MNLSLIVISFAFPGTFSFIDNYQIAIQKMVIHRMDRTGPRDFFHRNHPDPYTANAIQFSELSPYLDELQPGTLFFSIHGTAVSNIFIKGTWKHCGIYFGTRRQIEHYWGEDHDLVKSLQAYYSNDDEYLIFDSSYENGVAIHSMKDLAGLNETSSLRRLHLFEFTLDKEQWSQVLLSNFSHLGKEYDYCFLLDNDDALYCSEFLYEVLPLERDYFVPSAKIVGRKLLLPTDLIQSILNKGISSGAFISRGIVSNEGEVMSMNLPQ